MISLDLMKSSEVKIAGDPSNKDFGAAELKMVSLAENKQAIYQKFKGDIIIDQNYSGSSLFSDWLITMFYFHESLY